MPSLFNLNDGAIEFGLDNRPNDFTLTGDVLNFRLNAIKEESGDFRLLEDGDFRLLEDGEFRLLE